MSTFVTHERLWDPDTGQLAYGVGATVPTAVRHRLVPDSEWESRRVVPDTSQPTGERVESATAPRKTPAKKAAAKKAPRKTTARRTR